MNTIFFRGRNTSAIIADAQDEGIVRGEVVIICRDNDDFAEQADIELSAWLKIKPHDHVIVVANGGTTEQQVSVLATLIEKNVTLCVYDVQRDGVKKLYEKEKENCHMCGSDNMNLKCNAGCLGFD